MLETQRLLLRGWDEDDLDAYVALHADPHVAYWLGGRLTPEEAQASLERNKARLAEQGWGMYAIERKEDGALMGLAGLQPIAPEIPCGPGVEASWRLAPAFWRHGYCTEAMQAILADASQRGELEIVSFTATTNTRSQAVMTRLGFERDAGSDFEHPNLPEGHTLRPHVVYRLKLAG
jgi:RimJ/RimL family protein N-acetyltransferase